MMQRRQRLEGPPVIILGGYENAVSIARSLGSRGVRVWALAKPSWPVRWSRYAEWIRLPESLDFWEASVEFLMGRESDHLKGSVLLAGERLRISTQLIDARSDQSLWGESYEEELRDVLSLQSQVARAIVEEIHVQISPTEEALLEVRRLVDPTVYTMYLKGRHLNNHFTQSSATAARQLFEGAIKRDPRYAAAYAGLADSYYLLSITTSLAPLDIYPHAKSAAKAALDLDETLADAHVALANVRFFFDWDWSGAESSFLRAIELNPSSAMAHWYYAVYLMNLGRFEDSIREHERAKDLDPLSVLTYQSMGYCLYLAGRSDESFTQLELAMEIDPDYMLTFWSFGALCLREGLIERACKLFERGVETSRGAPFFKCGLAVAYAKSGRESDARKILGELEETSKESYVVPSGLAFVHASLGNTERAIEEVERAYESRDSMLVVLGILDWFDPLRDDPRFQDLLRRMNFPE